MKSNDLFRIRAARILFGAMILIALVIVGRSEAGNAPVHMTSDWSHRHLVFSSPRDLMQQFKLSSSPRYVQQWVRRNAEKKGDRDRNDRDRDRDDWRWHRAPEPNTNPLHGDWNIYMGYNGDPTAVPLVIGTAGAGNFPAKFSFDTTSANCQFPAPSVGQQPDFVVFNTSLTGSATPISAIDTAAVAGEPGTGETIIITNPNVPRTLTLTAGTTTSNTGINSGSFIRDATPATQATNIAASINLPGNGNISGLLASASGTVVTVWEVTTGTSGNNITVGGTATGVTWSFPNFQDGASGIPSIVAFSNLYSSCTGAPSAYWAYNTGGQVVTSPVLSSDGAQVAFVQNAGGTASLVLLKWASSGTVMNPVTLASNPAYPACTAPCMLTIPFSTANFATASVDTNSSPFYDYANDALYVGENHGYLHKFTGVFNGTPAEVVSTPFSSPSTANRWPADVNANSVLTSPVFVDGAGGFGAGASGIFVADSISHLYRVDSTLGNGTNGIVTTGFLGNIGFDESPLVDSSTGMVYVFERVNAGSRASILQFTLGFAGGSTGNETVVSSNSTAPFSAFYAGVFDNVYFSSATGTGSMYVCSTNAGLTALWKVTVTAGILSAPTAGPTISTGNIACSPPTEFNNGATDWIFVSVTGSSVPSGVVNCPLLSGLSGGCIMSYDISPTAPAWGVAKATHAAAAVAGGASAIIVDNSSAVTGASQVYFSPLTTGNCLLPASAVHGIGGCATQMSQSGLN